MTATTATAPLTAIDKDTVARICREFDDNLARLTTASPEEVQAVKTSLLLQVDALVKLLNKGTGNDRG